MKRGWYPRSANYPERPVPHEAEKAISSESDSEFDSIQDAIDATGTGGTVTVGPGTFEESVTINADGVSLVGSGSATVIDTSSVGGEAVNVASGNDCAIRDLMAVGPPDNSAAVIYAANGEGLILENIIVHEDTGYGPQIEQDSSLVSNLRVRGTLDGPGLHLNRWNCVVASFICEAIPTDQYALRITDTGNTVTGMQKTGTGSGIRISDNGNQISDAVIDTPSGEAVRVNDGTARNNLSNINAVGAGSYGFRIAGQDMNLTNLTALDAQTIGIVVETTGSEINVSNSQFTGSVNDVDVHLDGDEIRVSNVRAGSIDDADATNTYYSNFTVAGTLQ